MELGIFKQFDGKKCCVDINGRAVWGYPGRDIEALVPNIAPGATVMVEVQQVPPRDPTGRPYNRFTRMEAQGQGAPPQARPIGNVAQGFAPQQPGPNYAPPQQPMSPAPQNGDRDEMIYTCGVVNNYVSNTGDTSIKGLLMATRNAQKSFRVAFRGERFDPEPRREDEPF